MAFRECYDSPLFKREEVLERLSDSQTEVIRDREPLVKELCRFLLYRFHRLKSGRFQSRFYLQNQNNSHGAKSGEYDARSSTRLRLSAKYRFTDSALWAGALFWCKIHELFFHNSCRFLRTRSRSVTKTDK
ncbi:hypothetical protein TNCV_4711051 [Trichonephila clavipes]|uniref:Uncharacterized protein n=1 Tax=Trichonephila clavipes TaxID=2585209 RepID=A0A8X6S4E7_TRICX|nr:hypothetical protein TNCV_4711051 [Trichonephila clavipes]